MKNFRFYLFTLLAVSALFCSCTKVKLNKSKKSLLTGVWKSPCTGPEFDHIRLEITVDGEVSLKTSVDQPALEGRIAQLKEEDSPFRINNRSTLVEHNWKIKFRKKANGPELRLLGNYSHITYQNGEYDTKNNFIAGEKILLFSADRQSAMVYVKR